MGTISLDKSQGARPSAAARLDRLPLGSFHKQVMWLIAYVFFFELGDINYTNGDCGTTFATKETA